MFREMLELGALLPQDFAIDDFAKDGGKELFTKDALCFMIKFLYSRILKRFVIRLHISW